MRYLYLLILVALLNISCSCNTPSTDATVGQTLPDWSEGCLDIHLINSGRGECCFYIMPDGTTLLVDAGEVDKGKINCDQRPNDETRPYITYANFIKHFLPEGKDAIDYCLPLIQGEQNIRIKNGMPQHFILPCALPRETAKNK